MPKILVITDNTSDQINGVVTTFKNIEPLAVADGYTIEYITPLNFKHWDAPKYPEVKISLPIGLGRKIQQINPDYIHIATEGTIGLAANLWCWRNGHRFNTSYHSRWPEFMKQMYGIPNCLTIAYLRWFHNHSGIVLTTTQTMVDQLHHQGYKSNIIPWTRGVDRSVFDSSTRTNNIAGKPILVSVGRVSVEKGLDDFCAIDWPGATKIVVGDGPYRSTLESRYPDVVFVGMKTGAQLAEYYANSDVFVFSSITDTFGVVIIESIACGTPVAAYRAPGPLDIIEEGVNGSMVEYGDELKLAIQRCLMLDRTTVEASGARWTWDECWKIFRDALIRTKCS